MNILKTVLFELKKHVWNFRFYTMFFSIIWISLFLTLEPLFFGKIIAELEKFYQNGFFNIRTIIDITIIWTIFVIVGQWVKYFVWQELSTRPLLIDYRESIKKYCSGTLDMSMGEYLWKNIWSIYKLIDRGTENKLFFFFSFFENYIFNAAQILLVIIILFILHIKMAIISLFLLPVMIWLWIFFIRYNYPQQNLLSQRWEEIFSIVGNAMSNFWLYKVLNLEKNFTQSIFLKTDKVYSDQMRLNKFLNISEIYTISLIMITRIFVLAGGIYFIKEWSLTLAELFIIFTYIWWIYFPLWTIFRDLRNSLKQLTEVERMYSVLGSLQKDIQDDRWFKINKVQGNISFQNVSFGYLENQKILKHINFEIKKGQKIALVGNTGAGKSTIVNLLLRFWDISQGEILLDGENINSLSKSSLRSHIGVVSQDNSLFNLTIEENLKFANAKATKSEMEWALKNAQADFVFDLPQGIKTVIGERWLKLSGGEKQRISLARLFLKNPEILILDEATSALDNTTEKKVDAALKQLMKGKTSIIIAHRLSTIQHADVIYMLEHGKIVESWNYNELMEKKGKFYHLANPDKLILW